ncbi:MAG: energy transducer TonB [Bacteroidia bacterium]|nr:energy transducer TonB [Bacteroidia bacterium]NNF32330.1 energy transducer TonB [Flavobacteriaceae bacterium]NNM09420.1 energy transducer TonB [Flavobacteriaceae bacterium]
MSLLDTKHKRKSMTITVILHLIILFLIFFVIGLKYMDPPLERGIAVNFGTTDEGSGNVQPSEPIKTAPKNTNPEPVSQPKAEIKEEVVTQENEDAPVIKNEKPQKEVKETPVKEQPKKEVKPDPKPDKSTTDALSSIINGPKNDGKAKGSEGNDDKAGDKGNPNGDPNASGYYGTGKGLDGDGNYLLGGRKALNKEKYIQDCNEAGTVVVSIEVDRSGKVINATPGVRGTTNNSRCLLGPAKRAALATRFNSDNKAPAKQIGKIIYRFRLSN